MGKLKTVFVITVVFLMSCSEKPLVLQTSKNNQADEKNGSNLQSTESLPKLESYSFEEFITTLNTITPPVTVEKTIAALPQELRNHFSLVHHSLSLQGSSYENPRVILSSSSGDFAITFNGDASQEKYQNLEILFFKEKESQFELRDIFFSQGKAQVSVANPAVCLNCHTSSPKPIYDPYDSWRGFYSEFRGILDSATDQDKLKSFVKKAKNHPRYKFLGDSWNRQLAFQSWNYFNQGETDLDPTYEPFLGESNSEIGIAFYTLNFRRLKSIVKSTPYFETYKYALAGTLRCKLKSEDLNGTFLPKQIYKKHKEIGSLNLEMGFDSDRAQAIAFLFEPRGIDTFDWSPLAIPFSKNDMIRIPFRNRFAMTLGYEPGALIPDRYDDSISANATDELAREDIVMLREFFQNDKDIHYNLKLNQMNEECTKLAQQSLEAFDQLLKNVTKQDIFKHTKKSIGMNPLMILNNCASCHVSSSNKTYPKLPFDNASHLISAIKNNPKFADNIINRIRSTDPLTVMPPNTKLKDSEKKKFIHFIEKLKATAAE